MDITEYILKDIKNCVNCMYYETYYADDYGGYMNECNLHGYIGFITDIVCNDFIKYVPSIELSSREIYTTTK